MDGLSLMFWMKTVIGKYEVELSRLQQASWNLMAAVSLHLVRQLLQRLRQHYGDVAPVNILDGEVSILQR